ncbi:hypothetical protein N0M98_20220 [Paenibacillus doosanensis]|uniref:Uncharacterized protein n=1 Tax=Paenibacillus konkukensis TaxID=2020716 RepID=A0ABY4RHT2_9BACL|nr:MULTISPECIES: hypothetical protein [Paenibacillus]MCS7462451.1 hypothetical protein [Paenibacillus doosanensis]UQZ81942.1 hypothetical protein SK3146_01099 [Paenibacillus konkukensis]
MGKIMAVVTADKQQVAGGAPIFFVKDADELQKVAFKLEKILDATTHDLENGTLILVDHKSSSS